MFPSNLWENHMSRSIIYITGRKQACVMRDGHTVVRAARRHIGTNSVALLLTQATKEEEEEEASLGGRHTKCGTHTHTHTRVYTPSEEW